MHASLLSLVACPNGGRELRRTNDYASTDADRVFLECSDGCGRHPIDEGEPRLLPVPENAEAVPT